MTFYRLLIPLVILGACAGQTPAATTAPPAAEAAATQAAVLQPPPFAEASAPRATRTAPTDPGGAGTENRRAIFDAAWTMVRDKHFDKTLGGVDWEAARAKYQPLALGAPDEPTFYRFLNEMLGQLGQSHLEVTGPGAEPFGPEETPTAGPAQEPGPASGEMGDPGVTVRLIEGRPTVTVVRPGSSAERAGLRPGYLLTHIAGRALEVPSRKTRPLRPVEERFQLRLLAARRLAGPTGTRVTVRYLDHQDRAGETMLMRERPPGRAVQFGWLPLLHPEVRVNEIGDVGIVAFNFFLLEPVLADVQKAIEGFRVRGKKGIVLDLRGNPGGLGAMAIPVAARLVTKPITLGTIQFRTYPNTLTATPPLGVKPFTGRVVILTDEGTASTSEILAAGLQEAGRATVVGDVSLGAALASAIERLPGGAVMQYVVADFRTPKGKQIEGRGVLPDRRVIETRAALKEGRDPVLDAALVAARASVRTP